MKGLLTLVSALGSTAMLLSSASAEEERRRNLSPFEEPEDPAHGCPVVCAQHQACVENRCVDSCRPACRRGTFCSASGECEPLPQPQVPVLTESDRQRLTGAESADSRTFVFVDLGGIVGFGARLGLELGRKDSVLFRAQLSNTGIMSHAEYVENEFQRFDWGFGGSVGYRHYESVASGNLRGFYFGGGLDYSVVRLQQRGLLDVAQLQHTAAPYAEFGYRWIFRNFAIGFGPTLALRYPVASSIVGRDRAACDSEVECREVRGRRFEGTMNLELGWFLP